ncbi:hypothetical protein G6F65_019524 [Rhizopus arrhizus]|nr:hypothetical protein G6F31_021250 [Rhizopus arrhizus]KAG1248611.1 hypothetical protein G6F65_019524 [Rhizopus arrhizus]
MGGMHQLAEVRHGLRETLAALRRVQSIRGELDGAVARGDAHDEPAARQAVKRGGDLGQIDRMAQGKDCAAGGKRDALGAGRQIG